MIEKMIFKCILILALVSEILVLYSQFRIIYNIELRNHMIDEISYHYEISYHHYNNLSITIIIIIDKISSFNYINQFLFHIFNNFIKIIQALKENIEFLL